MILRDSRLTRHPGCLTNGVHLTTPEPGKSLYLNFS